MSKYSYYKNRLADFSFPFACLDMEMLRQNIQTNLARAGSKNIRIASKSIRCRRVMEIIFEYDDQFKGVMTYHGEEAVFLAEKGFDDLLMAYPVVDRKILNSLAELISEGRRIYLMTDCEQQIDRIEEAGKKHGIRIPIALDIDLSDNYPGLRFGVWRSSIQNENRLEQMIDYIKTKNHVRLVGIMGYEAQIAGVGDQVLGAGLKNRVIQILKNRSLPGIEKRRKKAVEYIESAGFPLEIVNGGGTGSLETTQNEDVVTEVTVGSGFYNSHLFDYYKNFQLEPALFYGIQIVRKPAEGIYTCHGGGFIASGGVERIKAPVVYLPEGGRLDSMEGAGEVQTPIRFLGADPVPQLGDPVFLRHAKAGELCERFNEIIFLEKEGYQIFPTYRGEGKNFG